MKKSDEDSLQDMKFQYIFPNHFFFPADLNMFLYFTDTFGGVFFSRTMQQIYSLSENEFRVLINVVIFYNVIIMPIITCIIDCIITLIAI